MKISAVANASLPARCRLAIGIEKWAGQFLERNMGTLPFWIEPRLSFVTVLYAIGLTVLGAVVAGAMPALKVTKGIGARLKEGTAGSGLRFGGVGPEEEGQMGA